MIEVYVGKMPPIDSNCLNAVEVEAMDIPYLKASSDILLKALLLDGFKLTGGDIAAVLKQKRISLEKAAAVAPNAWRVLEAIAGYFQCEKPGLAVSPSIPFPHLRIACVESILREKRVKRVYFWADGLGEEGVRLLAEVCRRYGVDLVLFYTSCPPRHVLSMADRVVLGRIISSKLLLGTLGMSGLERELRPIRVSLSGDVCVESREPASTRVKSPLYRTVKVNFLEEAFGEKAQTAFDVLKEVIEGGTVAERSLLEVVDTGLYLKLLEYGYLSRGMGTVQATEKGLEAYARHARFKEG